MQRWLGQGIMEEPYNNIGAIGQGDHQAKADHGDHVEDRDKGDHATSITHFDTKEEEGRGA